MKSHWKYILFDLDGTLTDPKEGIINSIQYALRRYGIERKEEELIHFIGPPLHVSFMEFFPAEAEAHKAVDVYREYYATKGIYENLLFDGIPELLKKLKQQGKVICLATSKPENFAQQILQHFSIDEYFDVITGANMDSTRTEKAEVIGEVMRQLPLLTPETAVMIGDRKFDIIGAKAHGLDTIGVAFGYGSVEELEKEAPGYIVHSVKELGRLLLV